MNLLIVSFVTIPFFYEIVTYPETLTHLSFWTWFLHICSCWYSLFITDIDNSILLTSSVIGSQYVYFGYIFSLLVNPYLEYDLINSKRYLWKDQYLWTLFRSMYYHGIPYIFSYYYADQYELNNTGIYVYVSILFFYLICGLLLKCFNNYMLSPYHIYITTNSNKNIVISETGYILIQTLILLRVIYLNLKI